jgi:hypothetical protein
MGFGWGIKYVRKGGALHMGLILYPPIWYLRIPALLHTVFEFEWVIMPSYQGGRGMMGEEEGHDRISYPESHVIGGTDPQSLLYH